MTIAPTRRDANAPRAVVNQVIQNGASATIANSAATVTIEAEKKKEVERAQKTREMLKKKVFDDTNGEVKFSEVKKVFETENTSDDSKCAEQTYGRVTTKIINLIKNTPLTNDELKKINDVVFDVILSNTSKGAENGKRTESQRN